MSLAIAHEWMEGFGGAESTFIEMAAAFPEADLYALSVSDLYRQQFGMRGITSTFLDSGIFRERRSMTLPLMPLAWRLAHKSRTYDTIVTSTHAFAREFGRRGAHRHLSYVHAPCRYLWTPEIDGRGSSRLLGLPREILKRVDASSVASVHSFAVNSREVAERVQKFYGRSSVVIHPPVDVDFFGSATQPVKSVEGALLSVGRLIPYKRHDVVIHLAQHFGCKAVIAGAGPEENALRHLASRLPQGQIVFEISPSKERVRDLMGSSRALVFAPHEDFGIVPVEAQAAGLPVVALGKGGALDTVVAGVTGAFAAGDSWRDFAEAFERCPDRTPVAESDCRSNADRFSVGVFRRAFAAWVNSGGESGLPGSANRRNQHGII